MMAETIDLAAFRRAMGLFATGVTVVTAVMDGQIHGMTANAFSSLSLNPALVLVCVKRGAKLEACLQPDASFAINLLSASQAALSRHFAGGAGNERPPAVHFRPFAGVQRLEDSMCTVACTVERVLNGGDHVIVLGRVVDIVIANGHLEPLLFWQGAYQTLESSSSLV